MGALPISPHDQAVALVTVSKKYNIPLNALLGIYGQETSFGQDVTTSSAGAQGPFQFIQAAASQYGYPYTNTPTLPQFFQQADAWGKYLVQNNPSRSRDGWAPAMKGGYDEAQAESHLSAIPGPLKSALTNVIASGVLGSNKPTFGVFGIGPQAPAGTLPPGASISGPTSTPDVAGAITGVFQSAVADAKYAAVLVMVLAIGAFLIFKALSSASSSGAQTSKVVPVPV